MKTVLLKLPKGFTFEKLQHFVQLLDLEILDFSEGKEELDAETSRHIDEGIAEVKKGLLTSDAEVQRKALEVCTQ